MLAVNEYRGEREDAIKRSDVVGDYDVIIHHEKTIDDVKISEKYTFSETGAILKDKIKVGSYNVKMDNFITLRIDGVVFKGKLSYNWVDYLNGVSIAVSAVSMTGQPLFANKIISFEGE